MRQRKIAIIGLILTALSLAALVIIEMRFAEAVIETASTASGGLTGLSNEVSRHRDASLILLLFSIAAFAVTTALFVTTRQDKPLEGVEPLEGIQPQTNTPVIHNEDFEKLSLRTQRLEMELENARQIAKETTEQLKTTMLDIEEFALLAVKREVKMQEIREKLKKFKDGHGEEIVH